MNINLIINFFANIALFAGSKRQAKWKNMANFKINSPYRAISFYSQIGESLAILPSTDIN